MILNFFRKNFIRNSCSTCQTVVKVCFDFVRTSFSTFSVKMTGNKRNRITIKQKAEILDKIEGGAKKSDLADKYKIAPSTVTAICNNAQKIRADLARSGNDTNKTVQTSKLDTALITWLTSKRQQGHPVSGIELQQKALFFNHELKGDESFKVSFIYYTYYGHLLTRTTVICRQAGAGYTSSRIVTGCEM